MVKEGRDREGRAVITSLFYHVAVTPGYSPAVREPNEKVFRGLWSLHTLIERVKNYK